MDTYGHSCFKTYLTNCEPVLQVLKTTFQNDTSCIQQVAVVCKLNITQME